MKRTVAMVFLMTTLTLTISGCNTIAGAGKDIEQGGQAIQNSAAS
ncbi:entericidin A/B family lipoprotein [Vreelandella populi]|uniref:Entericidin A/B family lipoprotein n=1 Tax=Vreelandella populi TaxID=2498858 RepID=A0A433L9E9_9GAMM|nr:entericidin A/B family lipoprotein [Halomonas populi]RUR41267.1 entericidin A/B family lipoprotein [Halomonas populi]RUR44328.1 entericidin A/B family lipoprotein [Halomonas populi]